MTTKSQERTKQTGEVFTPRSLIREMLDRLPNAVWFDPNKTWLEPAAGDGNFLVEIKARLLQAGHDEIHILENMLFSIELIDDNHWALQHRLGYLINGAPNPRLNSEHFALSKISQLTQDLNDKNPYMTIGCDRDEVLHHRNHVCASGLEYDMSFGRTADSSIPVLEELPERDLGPWPETDTPDIGERYVVERMLGKQPQLKHEPVVAQPALPSTKPQKKSKTSGPSDEELLQIVRDVWDHARKPVVMRALAPTRAQAELNKRYKFKSFPPELLARIKALVDSFDPVTSS